MNRDVGHGRRIIHRVLLFMILIWSTWSVNLLMDTPRIAQACASRQTAQISGHTPARVQKATLVEKSAATMPLDHLEAFLTLRNQQSLDGLLIAQDNLAALQYYPYLSPAALGRISLPHRTPSIHLAPVYLTGMIGECRVEGRFHGLLIVKSMRRSSRTDRWNKAVWVP